MDLNILAPRFSEYPVVPTGKRVLRESRGMINCSSSNYQLVRPTGVPFSVLTFPSFSRPKSIRLIIVTTLPFPLVQLIRNMGLECDVFASVDRTYINLSQLARIARRKLILYKSIWCNANWEIFPRSIEDISMTCYDFIARYFFDKTEKIYIANKNLHEVLGKRRLLYECLSCVYKQITCTCVSVHGDIE